MKNYLLLTILALGHNLIADTLVFSNGAVLNGTINRVDERTKSVTIRAKIQGRSYIRRYPFSSLRSLTKDGEKRDFAQTPSPSAPATTSSSDSKTQQQIIKTISTTGASAPSWLASTRLNYPNTLDLTWPQPSGKWNARKHIPHYLYSNVVANQGRWREGIRFLHFMFDRSRNNATVRNNASRDLGRYYFEFFRDYPRAAYWLRQSSLPTRSDLHAVLAECYFRMGNQAMALKSLAGKPALLGTAKLMGAMGMTDQAVRVADALARGSRPREAMLTAGDALALAGRYPEALKYYQRVLAERRPARNPQYLNRFKTRATQSIASIQLYETLDVTKLRIGTYTESSVGYEGPVRVEVKLASGKITNVRVVAHKEKQFYSALRDTPAKIIAKQTVKDIDATSGATVTAQAIINAAAKALNKAR